MEGEKLALLTANAEAYVAKDMDNDEVAALKQEMMRQRNQSLKSVEEAKDLRKQVINLKKVCFVPLCL